MAVAKLSDASVAVQVTVVSPNWNSVGALLAMDTIGSTKSDAVGIPISTATGAVDVATNTSSGAVIVGGVVSTIVTV